MKWLFRSVVIVALLSAAALGYILYPHWTLGRIDKAMRAGDIATLDTLIDWDRVRASVRADMSALMAKTAREKAENSGFVALGAAIGGAAMDRMVDGAITPSGLIDVMKANTTKNKDELVSRAWFTSPATFVVALRAREEDGGGELPIQVVMELSGVTWRVTRLLIDVPGLEALMAERERASKAREAGIAQEQARRRAADLVEKAERVVADWRDEAKRNGVDLSTIMQLRFDIGNIDADDPMADRAIAVMGELSSIREVLIREHEARQRAAKPKPERRGR